MFAPKKRTERKINFKKSRPARRWGANSKDGTAEKARKSRGSEDNSLKNCVQPEGGRIFNAYWGSATGGAVTVLGKQFFEDPWTSSGRNKIRNGATVG